MSNIVGEPLNTELFIPQNSTKYDHELPEVSIVIPALNEKITIGEFVDWCWQGLSDAGVKGEIIIVDSSSDETPNIALSKGARVLRTPKRGLGQAYLDAIPYIRGEFIIMGDCDLTYDFREIKAFVDKYHEGSEFVMGSRFKGSIEDGAMPALHRYFGTPITTWILNTIYGSNYSDIHCGMRGLTKKALHEINLTSTGWEYASEMVLKASRLGLSIAEVPVKFYKDRDGRLSHHRRAGFWSPWHAGWINLKIMLTYSPDSFILKPGLLLVILGLLVSVFSSINGIEVFGIGFGRNIFVAGGAIMVLGVSLIETALLARAIHGLRPGVSNYIMKKITYDIGMLITFFFLSLGILLVFNFVLDFVISGHKANSISSYTITGFYALIIGFKMLGFTLVLELIRKKGIL